MSELLTKEETALAASQGWCLSHVYDLETMKWRVQVYGSPRCDVAEQYVITQARMGNALAIKALRLIQASHQQGTT